MKDKKFKYFNNFFTGLLIGFIVPSIVLYLLFLFNKIPGSFTDYVLELNENRILTKVISICVLPLLGVFYLYLRKNWFSGVKGMISAVFIMIFWVIINNYLM
jgi:hypothetical protein